MAALLPWESADRMRVGKLRVRGGTASSSLRLGLSAMLDRADLRPPGIPPAAVLFVRRMDDPLPRRIAPWPLICNVDGAWERAVREELARLYHDAARPGRDAVPADAEAVVFANEGELLASLALDLAGGRISEHWWWRNFGGSFMFAAPSPLASLLCDRAIWVPAALALLARQDRAVVVLRALAPTEALAVVAAVSRIHGAATVEEFAASQTTRETPSASPPSANEVEDGTRGVRDAGRAPRPAEAAASEGEAVASRRAAAAPPPWAPWLPDRAVPAELHREQKCLLGVALVLHHRPEAVRNVSFAAALRSWWYASDRESERSLTPPRLGSRPALPSRTAPETRNAAPLPRRVQPFAETGAVPAQSPLRTSVAASASPLTADRPEISEAPFSASPFPAPRSPVTPLFGDAGRIGPDVPPARETPLLSERSDGASGPILSTSNHSARSSRNETSMTLSGDGPLPAVDGALASTPHDSAAAHDDWGLILEEGIETTLGGVLFLINLMCALDLPECFEEEWRLASIVGSWGVLEALGRALLAGDSHFGDPIWPTLAALSGCSEGERLGAGLPRRAAYRLPAVWSAQLPDDGNEPQAWAAHGGRLRLWSRAGYLLSETRRDASPAAVQAKREAQRWGLDAAPPRARFADAPLAVLPGPLLAGIDPALRRWLGFVVPFLRWRLVSALAIDPMEASLMEVLLARPGRLYVTATHVDLVMGPETVSLPVRLAGLDRNPGWLGEFGRVIMFHFE